ncbi:MAG: hypothetical protein V8R40_13310 [Dysosmobacter sp.]
MEITVEEPKSAPRQRHLLDAAPLTPTWDSAAAQAAAAGCNSVAVTLKDASGGRASPRPPAAMRTESTTAAALAAMTAATYTIARLSCLLDPIAAKADVEGMGLKEYRRLYLLRRQQPQLAGPLQARRPAVSVRPCQGAGGDGL